MELVRSVMSKRTIHAPRFFISTWSVAKTSPSMVTISVSRVMSLMGMWPNFLVIFPKRSLLPPFSFFFSLGTAGLMCFRASWRMRSVRRKTSMGSSSAGAAGAGATEAGTSGTGGSSTGAGASTSGGMSASVGIGASSGGISASVGMGASSQGGRSSAGPSVGAEDSTVRFSRAPLRP